MEFAYYHTGHCVKNYRVNVTVIQTGAWRLQAAGCLPRQLLKILNISRTHAIHVTSSGSFITAITFAVTEHLPGRVVFLSKESITSTY